jgi:acyl-CoA hydrolase
MTAPLFIETIDACVDHLLETINGPIVLGIPLGVGKPNPLVNALYRRIKATPTRQLRIITALSLERPVGHSALEKSFLQPFVERVFGDYPDMDYVKDLRAGQLPPNIEVQEFFMKTGDYLGNIAAQMAHISTNYTFAARDMAVQGMNLIAQAVGSVGQGDTLRLSLSSNPDITHAVADSVRGSGKSVLIVGVINHKMPFMPNGAEVSPDFFDVVVTDPAGTHDIFAPPNNKVSAADYAIGLHASSLVRDGGTLQIGIGSLGDAVGQALIVRDQHGDDYQHMLASLCPNGLAGRELGRFESGLYGCSEMLVNAFLRLIEVGIIRREVYDDAVLQQLLNSGTIPKDAVTPQTLLALLDAGRIRSPLSEDDLAFLKHFGILRAEVTLLDQQLRCGAHQCGDHLRDPACFEVVRQHMLGTQLLHGIYMTGGFFLGPRDFYERLRSMAPQELAKIDMTQIDFINQLYGDDALKRAQRHKASFMNTTMVVTLLGAAASDTLESGQVVSGVGGQYNFVAMSHALHDARMVMMLRATHDNKHGLKSNIVWNYGSVTIPRHMRDVVITEYGIAELRGQSDGEVVKRLIAIADSRFQAELVKQAKAHGKLEADYEVPACFRQNLPEVIAAKIKPWSEAGLLPDFPFGTDLTEDELHIVRALKKMKQASQHPAKLLTMVMASLWQNKQAPPSYLARLGLTEVHSVKDRLMRRLFANSL